MGPLPRGVASCRPVPRGFGVLSDPARSIGSRQRPINQVAEDLTHGLAAPAGHREEGLGPVRGQEQGDLDNVAVVLPAQFGRTNALLRRRNRDCHHTPGLRAQTKVPEAPTARPEG